MNIYQWANLSNADQETLLRRPIFDQSGKMAATQAIIDEVRAGGDEALLKLTRKFDGCSPASLRVPGAKLEQAANSISAQLKQAINNASDRIYTFHAADMPQDTSVETSPGLVCSVRYQAISPIGLYVPGGSAPLISTILMLAIPAKLAGCTEVVLCTPPGKDGNVPDEMLAAASYCGVICLASVSRCWLRSPITPAVRSMQKTACPSLFATPQSTCRCRTLTNDDCLLMPSAEL